MELLTLVVAMAATGAIAGILAGLLGVGGGIVIVPVLEGTLAWLGVDAALRMHIAVATSMATIIPTSIASAYSHHRHQAVDRTVASFWAPFILVGAVAGVWLAAAVSGRVLAAVFAAVAALAAVRLLLPQTRQALRKDIPRSMAGGLLPTAIGLISALMGIGGGTMSVPALTLCGRPVHIAVGTSALLGLFIAVPATLAYIVAGWQVPALPTGNIGYVSLVGLVAITPFTVLFAPLGARFAHRLSKRHLSAFFGAFLLLVAIRMAWRALA